MKYRGLYKNGYKAFVALLKKVIGMWYNQFDKIRNFSDVIV